MQQNHSLQLKNIDTLDLNFMGIPGAIAAYLIPHAGGAVLVECGPGSTLPALLERLGERGLSPADVTDVLLTHIHLDHAGAAGWLARQGARIHVHPVGAPHLLNPEKLLSSAARIYGDMMDTLWGEFLPVPEEQLSVLQDGEALEIEELRFIPLDTPGHADHHFAYLYQDTLFSGDIGGVRLAGLPHIRLPVPPPEFHLEKWRDSVAKMNAQRFSRIAPTHFGIYEDRDWHLKNLAQALDDLEHWMEATLPSSPDINAINTKFLDWTRARSEADRLQPEHIEAYEAANPSWMSGYGIQRYWKKYRMEI